MTPYTMLQKTSNKHVFLVYLQAYFVTIATILGTGILGLPVTLVHSGLYPFLVSFLIGAFEQIVLVYFFTELLQISQLLQIQGQKEELVPLNDLELEDDAGYLASDEEIDSGTEEHVTVTKPEAGPQEMIQSPNLHSMGKMFLGPGLRHAFDVILVLQFIGLLISYALAGSEAYAELIGIRHIYIIPVFVWILTLAIVFALQFIQPVVSVLTFFKGSLLLGTVILTFYAGAEIDRNISNDFRAVGAPFLMGTVALGGVINTMPLMYSKISPVRHQIKYFRMSVILGLLTCTVLNVLWCWAVLDIVPQKDRFICNLPVLNMSTSTRGEMGVHYCHSNISLESAANAGEISTIPLTLIIQEKYPSFTYVATSVELFITVSITVSYLTVGAVLHHTLNGWISTVWKGKNQRSYQHTVHQSQGKNNCCSSYFWCKTFLSLAMFSVVFMVAMLDPEGFVDMLETFASLTINLEAGLFVFLMLINARRQYGRHLKIPLPIPSRIYWLQFTIPVYFGTAVAYDIYNTIRKIVQENLPRNSSVGSESIVTQHINFTSVT